MKKHLVRYLLGCAILLLLIGHAAKIYHLGLVDRLDAIIYDTKLRLTMPQGVNERVVILDIDEKSLAEIGRWPWSRNRMSALVDKLFKQYGIRVLGFDIGFAEADNSSGLHSLETLARKNLKDNSGFQTILKGLRPQLDYDARFAETLRGKAVILGFFLTNSDTSSGALPPPVLPEDAFSGRAIAFTTWQSHGGNLAEFQKNAAGGGHISPIVDLDGIIRRVPMLAEHQGAYYEALSLAMVRAYLNFPKVVPGYPDDAVASKDLYGNMEWLDLPTAHSNLRIPVDENVAALIPYRGYEKSFRYYSIADVLADRIPHDLLKGRMILIGTTAPGLKDQRSTPVGESYPGVEVHANLITGMLEGSIKEKPAFALAVDMLLLLIAGGIMVFLLPLLSAFRASVTALLVLLSLLGVNMAFWQYGNFVLPLAAGLLLLLSLYALNMSWGYFVESRSKRQFTELFGQYVPPELVDEMSRNPEGYTMDGRKAELTVLFSDIRGFTTISEGLEPDQLATLMNEYLGAMTEVIRHQRGTLDKYIGDAIMAFWGAPVSDEEHARHAVLAALGMQQELLKLNQVFMQKGWPELKIGVGVNTGSMTVGDMGSPVRKAYTVMGDAVNLGARLEGITKQYGVGIIVGETTRNLLQTAFVFRELDRVRVKGKVEPIGIYQPLGVAEEVGKEVIEELSLWHQALRYYRAQDWERAETALLSLTRKTPCYLYELYTQRIEVLRQQPPGEDWDGVTTFETK